jgi:hypothetical protein
MTAKYSTALIEANRHRLDTSGNQEALYERLEAIGLLWDSSSQEWLTVAQEPADPPTELVMIRVWAKTEDVEAAAGVVARAYEATGYRLIERSRPYLCRPPKQLESRVYLKFLPKGK